MASAERKIRMSESVYSSVKPFFDGLVFSHRQMVLCADLTSAAIQAIHGYQDDVHQRLAALDSCKVRHRPF